MPIRLISTQTRMHNRVAQTCSRQDSTHFRQTQTCCQPQPSRRRSIIDQYRAHTRILYEGYIEQMQKLRPSLQKPLFPDTIHFSASDKVVVEAVMPELQNIGFELTPNEEGDYTITAVPSGLDGLDYVALVQDLVASAREKTTSAIDDINHSIALELARNAAVTYGQVLTNAEMENIVNSLFACSNFSYTPDGKKILTMLRQTDLEQLFGV